MTGWRIEDVEAGDVILWPYRYPRTLASEFLAVVSAAHSDPGGSESRLEVETPSRSVDEVVVDGWTPVEILSHGRTVDVSFERAPTGFPSTYTVAGRSGIREADAWSYLHDTLGLSRIRTDRVLADARRRS